MPSEGEVLEINGATVEIEKCSHAGCKAGPPTMEEIRRAVYRSQNIRTCAKWRCAYCGEPVKAKSYLVCHDADAWVAWEKEVEPAVSLRIQPQNDREVSEHNGLHLRCVPKALPFVNGLALKTD